MTVTELLPQLHELSRVDKLAIIKALVEDLEMDLSSSSGSTGVLLSEQEQLVLAQIAGSWTEEDEQEFMENTKFFSEIDEELWN